MITRFTIAVVVPLIGYLMIIFIMSLVGVTSLGFLSATMILALFALNLKDKLKEADSK